MERDYQRISLRRRISLSEDPKSVADGVIRTDYMKQFAPEAGDAIRHAHALDLIKPRVKATPLDATAVTYIADFWKRQPSYLQLTSLQLAVHLHTIAPYNHFLWTPRTVGEIVNAMSLNEKELVHVTKQGFTTGRNRYSTWFYFAHGDAADLWLVSYASMAYKVAQRRILLDEQHQDWKYDTAGGVLGIIDHLTRLKLDGAASDVIARAVEAAVVPVR